ncbi:hypothetical protein [Streptosporangium oxazolinicum]
MTRILAVLGLVAALTVLSGGTASACSCAPLEPRQRMDLAAAVFSATAVDVRVDELVLKGGSVTATLRADHVYKGKPGAEFEVTTDAQGASCGYEFTRGGRYLVFAATQDSELITTLCSGNRLLPAGDQPLRLSDRTQGTEELTPELISALGTPVRVSPVPRPPRTVPTWWSLWWWGRSW